MHVVKLTKGNSPKWAKSCWIIHRTIVTSRRLTSSLQVTEAFRAPRHSMTVIGAGFSRK
ncbi:hypothetical protein KIN20_035325 [Parelaphostrongylus tenuis]|uniref:Uncharacterized protein n=1 Tax=Parelaphostrongylus tenuis TaxID=148309 RepID=A0AAD5RAZ3_PARTN|nr:hypothetical protein KIN20_035325 [Parelaphostrongylus tenuis]